MPTTLTLSETAQRHGVAKSSLSEAVHDGRPVQDMNLHRYAVVENGRIQRFEFPSWYNFPSEEEEKEEETISMTFQELCEAHAPFHRGMVEEALRHEWPVDGFPIDEWVVRDEEGAVRGFEVPRNADFDPERRNATNVMGKDAESGEKRAAQGDRANEIDLSGGSDHSEGGETAKTGSNATGGLSALAGAAIFKLLTS